MYDSLMLVSLWAIGLVLLVYGTYGLKSGKIRAYSRTIHKDLKGKWAYTYSLILVILGGSLLIALIYMAGKCGFLVIC